MEISGIVHYLVARKVVRQTRRARIKARRQGTMIGARARWTGWGGGEGSRVWQVYVYNWLVYWYLRLLYWYIFTRQDGVVGEGSRAWQKRFLHLLAFWMVNILYFLDEV